jgi:ATP-dependent Clp protease ATP-binding subunit ClpC
MEISQNLKQEICKQGYSEIYGARPLKRMVTKYIEDTVSEEILHGRIEKGDRILLSHEMDMVKVEKIEKALSRV